MSNMKYEPIQTGLYDLSISIECQLIVQYTQLYYVRVDGLMFPVVDQQSEQEYDVSAVILSGLGIRQELKHKISYEKKKKLDTFSKSRVGVHVSMYFCQELLS